MFTILTIAMAKPCPCELITNEPLSNNPVSAVMDSTTNQFTDDENLEEYIDQIPSASQSEPSLYLSSSYPLFRLIKPLDTNVLRYKRPSWASVGKRGIHSINKRPSWAQIG